VCLALQVQRVFVDVLDVAWVQDTMDFERFKGEIKLEEAQPESDAERSCT
jgi:hypothetical protein